MRGTPLNYTEDQIRKIAALAAEPRAAHSAVIDLANEMGINRYTITTRIFHLRRGVVPREWAKVLGVPCSPPATRRRALHLIDLSPEELQDYRLFRRKRLPVDEALALCRRAA